MVAVEHRGKPEARIGAPPIPHEHGAWVMLFGPALAAWMAMPRWPGAPAMVFLVLVAAAFMGRNAAGLALRGRGGRGAIVWAAAFGATAFLATVLLTLVWGRKELLYIGVVAVAFFGAHSLLIARSGRKRLDRSVWGEVLAVAALALTGPAAWVAAGGHLDGMALALWLAMTLFFSSGVFSVKSRLNAVKVRGEFSRADRRSATRDSVAYHVLLTAVALGGAAAVGGAPGALLAVAFVPALVRAFHGAATMTNVLPNLKRVGAMETALAVWFIVFFAWALRLSV
jgi:hypothetical protein